jgi:AraC-like DNA-binding protein
MAYSAATDACLLAQHQAVLAWHTAQRSGVDVTALLKQSRIEEQIFFKESAYLSPEQYLSMLSHLARQLNSDDTSFSLGQNLLPGHFGAISHALLHAQNLRAALEILVQFQTSLCPLLTPRIKEEQGQLILYWMDHWGAPSALPFLVEMHMTAVTAMCRWLSEQRLPWRYCFNRAKPRHVEQHQVHLGSDLRFDCYLDAMIISSEYLDLAWPRGNALTAQVAQAQAIQETALRPQAQSIIPQLYDYLVSNLRCAPNLEKAAIHFDCSIATFKRHLARHGTHFQAELDQVRTHMALYLFHIKGMDNEAVASYLGFHDATNFRRSFKRWTGQTPSLLRHHLLNEGLPAV